MTSTTESYTAVASQAREATEKSVEAWKNGAKTFTEQANVVAKLPTLDLVQPVERYFEYVLAILGHVALLAGGEREHDRPGHAQGRASFLCG